VADVIKRLHYFNGQFLREPDFTVEQSYHLQHQRDHVRLLHTPGIAEGLDIAPPPADATAVTVNAGSAFDDQGRRFVLANNKTVELQGFGSGQAVYITIAYRETQTDPTDEGGVTSNPNTRWSEDPLVEPVTTAPANPNQKLVLARIQRTGTVISGVDRSERRVSGVKGGDLEVRSLTLTSDAVAPSGWVKAQLGASGQADLVGNMRVTGNLTVSGTITGDIAVGTVQAGDIQDGAVTLPKLASNSVDASKIVDGSVGTNELANLAVSAAKLADGAVTLQKLAAAVQSPVSLDGVSNPGGNIDLVPAASITIIPDNTAKRITIGETHSSAVGNPHATTAAQIDAQGGVNQLVTQINNGTGVLTAARIDAAIAREADLAEKLNGEFVQGSIVIPGSGSIFFTVTTQNLLNRLVAVRGWASAVANGAPGLISGNFGRWSPLPANFREGWAICLVNSVGFGGFFSFVEGALTINMQLNIGSNGASFFMQAPAGTNVGYAFQFTWQ
jgi:hypothetical protein